MKSPTAAHPNRGRHNWLAYRLLDRDLRRVSGLIRGDVLDAGCGTGVYRDFLLRTASRYIGIDWGSSQHRCQPDIVANLSEPLPIPDESFDTVFCISVLEHLSNPQRAVAEFGRVLRPGGALILQVPWQWQIHEAPHDYFRFTPYALRKICADAGLAAVEISSQGGVFSMLALKFTYLSRRLLRGPRPVRALCSAALWPAWALAQGIAPILDRLDRDWEAETGGYVLVARKACGVHNVA